MPVGLKPVNATPEATCTKCEKTSKALKVPLKRCSACKATLYCSEACQKADRARHIPECQAFKAAAAEAANQSSAAKSGRASAKKAEQAAARKEEDEILAANRREPEPPRPDAGATTSDHSPSSKSSSMPKLKASTSAKRSRGSTSSSQPSTSSPETPWTLPMHMPPGYTLPPFLQNIQNSIMGEMAYNNKIMSEIYADPECPAGMSIGPLLPAYPPSAYLSSVPSEEVPRQLIDSYRLRVEDHYTFHSEALGLYGGADPYPDFRRYLDMAEENGVVPSSWTPVMRKGVIKLAQDKDGGYWLRNFIEKSDVIKEYQDETMPFKLRELASKVYGSRIINGLGPVGDL